MSTSGSSSLVSCNWLNEQILGQKNPASNIVLLETSFEKRENGHQSFLRSHIATARYFDLWEGVNPSSIKPRDFPEPTEFEKHAQSHGINKESHIIIFDKGSVYYAARLWFTFKTFGHNNVSVLDGGMMYWNQLKLPVESGKPEDVKAGNFQICEPCKSWFKSYKDICADREAAVQIVDTRLRDDYLGTNEEPSLIAKWGFDSAGVKVPDSMHAGHIPGSKCIGFPDFMDHDTTAIIPKDKLIQMFKTNGVDPEKPITGLCYNGVSACLIPLVVSTLTDNYEKLFSLYIGSWSEYSQKAAPQDIETGEDFGESVNSQI